MKPALGVAYAPDTGEQAALALLRAQGYAVPYGTPDAPPESGTEVLARNLRTFRLLTPYPHEHRVMLGLADALKVGGVDVPVYVHVPTAPERDEQGYFLVLGGSPEEAERYLRANQADLGGLLLLALLDSYDLRESELCESDETLYAGELGDVILHDFIRAFFPERAQAQEEVEQLSLAQYRLKTAIDALTAVDRFLPALKAETAPCLTRLQDELQWTRTRSQRLVEQHHLS